MTVKGAIIKYGDNVDTDVIIPARYLNTSDKKELASHCMEDLDNGFAQAVKTRSIMVAGSNFGCGSSREHAPIALKESGISLIIAKSFARIFYRNSINIGLPIVECPEAADEIAPGDQVGMDFDSGVITNYSKNKEYKAVSFPKFIQSIIEAGGLISAVTNNMFGVCDNEV